MSSALSLPEKAEFATEAGHFYWPDGRPCYTVIGSTTGKPRPTTRRDAEKLGLYPGATTVTSKMDRPALRAWNENQVLLAALTLPHRDGESEQEWIKRVKLDAKEQARKAAERGVAIHGAIEKAYRGELVPPALAPWVGAAKEVIADSFRDPAWSPERSFAHPLGYGGKVDLHGFPNTMLELERLHGIVIDIKTKDGDIETLKPYDETIMQLAAYAHGLRIPDARCAVLFVSRTVAAARLVVLEGDQIERGWRMFTALLTFWQHSTGYAPRAA